MPVRLGVPAGVTGLTDVINNPIHATGVGLLLFGLENRRAPASSRGGSGGIDADSVWGRMKSWFQGHF